MHYVRSCKSPCELCAWLTLFLAALVAWDVAPEYNFMIGVFGLIAVRADDARLVSYMALTVPLLVIADISYFFLADLSGFSFWICFVMFFIKIMWTYFSARFVSVYDSRRISGQSVLIPLVDIVYVHHVCRMKYFHSHYLS